MTRRLPVVGLYVPGDRPDRFDKALGAGADQVFFDLEDAVAVERKEFAREAVREYLGDADVRRRAASLDVGLVVRVNGQRTPWWIEDADVVSTLPGLDAVRLPKVSSAEAVAMATEAFGLEHGPGAGIVPLIEDALGVEAAFEIARASHVAGLGMGEADLRADLGLPDEDVPHLADDGALGWVRTRIVVAARAADLPAPHLAAYTRVRDDEGLVASCRAGAARGFAGRSAIHPRQIAFIRNAFAPTTSQIEWAHAVLEALRGHGVAVLPDGTMVDEAMAARARSVLSRASKDA